ncbi:unnamed protein product [Aspergillus oryzae RIB40]|uniref:2-oxoglutarate dehydrogenase, mitochondrial n=1 Tax=Aspergillus oryzae (strain ATCC 42149 / RIB 40) TaxID=510516 RepID=Q2UQN4_ASPOR|nr:unnamed protein product [Aspergillus oryzae RIB40]BAE56131.1 unnamed protein product [Aspergillus oryzae RIB40]
MMYSSWKNDPSSVHLSWQAYFHNVENGHIPMDQAFMSPPGLVTASTRTSIAPSSREDSSTVKQLKVIQLIQAYQRWGHEHASTDPLGMANEGKICRKELQLSHYGLSEQDLDLVLTVGTGSVQDFTSEKPKPLWEVIAACEKTYCSTMGIEYMHISNQEQVDWIRARIEGAQRHRFTDEEKRRMLHGLVRATSWEKFVATKFPNEKRFGLDGVESYIPALETAIDRSAEHGVDKIEMGVAHRGRMNMLYNIVGKDGASMFRDFDPKGTSSWGIPGDIKYHYGGSGERVTPSGKKVYMNVLPQPSHLDSVNPVAMGKTRGIQDRLADERESTMMLNVHTDASFAAQGTIYETLGLSGLPGYTTGGTLRVIVNNQVGFTTDMWLRCWMHQYTTSMETMSKRFARRRFLQLISAHDSRKIVWSILFAIGATDTMRWTRLLSLSLLCTSGLPIRPIS